MASDRLAVKCQNGVIQRVEQRPLGIRGEKLMADVGENAVETGIPNSGSAAFAPFEAWSEWLRNNMGAMSASPGSNGEEEEAEAVPEGATASDPLMSAMGELSDANPM